MSTRGKVARGKPAYDDATEIYGRSAHPFGLRPKDCARVNLQFSATCQSSRSSGCISAHLCGFGEAAGARKRVAHWRAPTLFG